MFFRRVRKLLLRHNDKVYAVAIVVNVDARKAAALARNYEAKIGLEELLKIVYSSS